MTAGSAVDIKANLLGAQQQFGKTAVETTLRICTTAFSAEMGSSTVNTMYMSPLGRFSIVLIITRSQKTNNLRGLAMEMH
jgi:hypothetical protein